jgi:aldose 1-epimerase
MKITLSSFGTLEDGKEATLFTLENDRGIQLKLTNFGGTMIELWVPDRNGNKADVLLGYRTWEDWKANIEPYFNCIVGRTCNRIGGARFTIDRVEYEVTPNRGSFQLHGGNEGFNRKLWKAQRVQTIESVSVILEYLSNDGEEGFPGNLQVKAVYSLNNQNEVSIEYYAMTDRPTPVNLTCHAYWNLAGESSGDILEQQLQIFADHVTEVDDDLVPTGNLKPIQGTALDFTVPHALGERIGELYMGYDDNYCLRTLSGKPELAAKAFDPKSGRLMEVITTEPGLQLYTANWFDGTIHGKGGTFYKKHSAFCTETQHWPDSMNHMNFPNVILRPGNTFKSKTIWKFSTADSII